MNNIFAISESKIKVMPKCEAPLSHCHCLAPLTLCNLSAGKWPGQGMPHKAGPSQVTTPACRWLHGEWQRDSFATTESNQHSFQHILQQHRHDSHKDMILMYSQSYSPTASQQQEQQQADRRDESAAATWQTHQTICQADSFSLCCFARFMF